MALLFSNQFIVHPIIQSEYGSDGRKRKNVITFKNDLPN